MTRQLKLYLCLSALCACVFAFPSDKSLNVVEKNNIDTLKTVYAQSVFQKCPKKNVKLCTHLGNFNQKFFRVGYSFVKTTLCPAQDKGEQPRFSGNKGEITKIEKPVNERYPHAVLFGGTCGGTIISPTWILTAAHCTINTSGRRILAGTDNSDDYSGITHYVKRKIIHPRFSVGPYWLDADDFKLKQVGARFDYMLVELKKPLQFDNKTIDAAKLNENRNLVPKTNVGYAGYGTKYHGGTMRYQMHEMKLELLSEDKCSILKEYDSQDMICAKGRPPNYDSACNGDSGSGLVDENGVLVGILSWAEDDAIECRNGATVYFSKIAEARDWIREVANV